MTDALTALQKEIERLRAKGDHAHADQLEERGALPEQAKTRYRTKMDAQPVEPYQDDLWELTFGPGFDADDAAMVRRGARWWTERITADGSRKRVHLTRSLDMGGAYGWAVVGGDRVTLTESWEYFYGPHQGDLRAIVVAHELGHALGCGHVDEAVLPHEIMSTQASNVDYAEPEWEETLRMVEAQGWRLRDGETEPFPTVEPPQAATTEVHVPPLDEEVLRMVITEFDAALRRLKEAVG